MNMFLKVDKEGKHLDLEYNPTRHHPRGNPPFEDVSPIEHGDFPMSCWFSGVYWTFGQFFVFLLDIPLWKFNSSSLNIYRPKRKGSSSNHHFSGAMSNFGGVHSRKLTNIALEKWWQRERILSFWSIGRKVYLKLPTFTIKIYHSCKEIYQSDGWYGILRNPS